MPDFGSLGAFKTGKRRHWPSAEARRGI